MADERYAHYLPSFDFLEQEGCTSYRASFYWTFRINFLATSCDTCIKSKYFVLPIFKNQVFSLLFLKHSDYSFSIHFLRMPIDLLQEWEPLTVNVVIHLLDAKKPPITNTLQSSTSGISAFYEVSDVRSGKINMEVVWTVRCTVEVESLGKWIEYTLDTVDDKNKHTKKMRLDMEALFSNSRCSDIIIRGIPSKNFTSERILASVANKSTAECVAQRNIQSKPIIEYFIHKPILAVSSPYFNRLLEHNSLIDYIDESQNEIYDILRYMYVRLLHLDLRNVFFLIEQSERFAFQDVLKKCLRFLRYNVTVENALKICNIARFYGDTYLEQTARVVCNKHIWIMRENLLRKCMFPNTEYPAIESINVMQEH